jgi:twitching motility protein PilT
VAAVEIMLANNVIKRLIRDHKIFEVPPNIEMGSREGMQTLEMAMADLVKKGMVSQEDAMAKCSNPAKLNDLMYRAGATDPNASKGRMVGQGAGAR